jgi:phosphoglycerate dehydrogenase-like enzyme
VVDEIALFDALSDGHLGGAGLDVWYNYPMLPGQGGFAADGDSPNLCPASRPFWSLPNVVMSPHRGQSSDTKAQDRVDELLGMLRALHETGELPNRYDIGQGY